MLCVGRFVLVITAGARPPGYPQTVPPRIAAFCIVRRYVCAPRIGAAGLAISTSRGLWVGRDPDESIVFAPVQSACLVVPSMPASACHHGPGRSLSLGKRENPARQHGDDGAPGEAVAARPRGRAERRGASARAVALRDAVRHGWDGEAAGLRRLGRFPCHEVVAPQGNSRRAHTIPPATRILTNTPVLQVISLAQVVHPSHEMQLHG